jgi:hypothetical protein
MANSLKEVTTMFKDAANIVKEATSMRIETIKMSNVAITLTKEIAKCYFH